MAQDGILLFLLFVTLQLGVDWIPHDSKSCHGANPAAVDGPFWCWWLTTG